MKLLVGKSITRTDISNLLIISTHVIEINTKYFCDSNGKRFTELIIKIIKVCSLLYLLIQIILL